MGVTAELARFVVETSYEDIDPKAIEVAKRVNLDTLGVALAGSTQPVGKIATRHVKEVGGVPEAGVLAAGFSTSTLSAAFANGVLAHALDFDDTWVPLGHPTCTVFPVILALGEKLKLSGKKLLEAFVLGLELHGKIGYGHSTPGFHSTGIFGAVAAAAAAAKLLSLDQWQTRMALGIAASHAGGLARNWGTMTKPYHAGNAAFGGLRAALLAREGFTADEDIIEGENGFADGFFGVGKHDPQAMVQNLGNPWHLVSPGIGIKKYPSCYINHRALDAMLQLARGYNIEPDQVEEVRVEVPHAGVLNNPNPDTGLRGKFSLQYNMAAALVDKKIVIETFHDQRVHSPEIQEMLRKVHLEINPTIPADYKDMYNPVRVTLKDGRTLSARVDVPHGDWDDPLDMDEVLAKYRDNARLVLSPEDTERTIDIMTGLEKQESIAGLMELVTREPGAK